MSASFGKHATCEPPYDSKPASQHDQFVRLFVSACNLAGTAFSRLESWSLASCKLALNHTAECWWPADQPISPCSNLAAGVAFAVGSTTFTLSIAGACPTGQCDLYAATCGIYWQHRRNISAARVHGRLSSRLSALLQSQSYENALVSKPGGSLMVRCLPATTV